MNLNYSNITTVNPEYLEATFHPLKIPITFAGQVAGVFFSMIVFHEFGHYLYFRTIGQKVKIRLAYHNKHPIYFRIKAGSPKDYKNLSVRNYIGVNLWGIFFGIIPIVYFALDVHPILWLMFLPYLVGCRNDIKEVIKGIKWEYSKRS